MVAERKKGKASGERERPSFRSRPMEGYSIAVTESIKNLSEKAVERGMEGGISEGYEDGVDDLYMSIPSFEKRLRRPDKALLVSLRFQRESMMRLAKDTGGPLDPTIDEVPDGKDLSYQSIEQWLEGLEPSRWGIKPSEEIYRAMRRARAMIKKQMAIDLLDAIDALRHREYESMASEQEVAELFADYERE